MSLPFRREAATRLAVFHVKQGPTTTTSGPCGTQASIGMTPCHEKRLQKAKVVHSVTRRHELNLIPTKSRPRTVSTPPRQKRDRFRSSPGRAGVEHSTSHATANRSLSFSAERASSSNLLPTRRSPAIRVGTRRKTYLQGEGCSRVCDIPVSRETSLIIRQSGAAGCGVLSKATVRQLRYRPALLWRSASTRIPTPVA